VGSCFRALPVLAELLQRIEKMRFLQQRLMPPLCQDQPHTTIQRPASHHHYACQPLSRSPSHSPTRLLTSSGCTMRTRTGTCGAFKSALKTTVNACLRSLHKMAEGGAMDNQWRSSGGAVEEQWRQWGQWRRWGQAHVLPAKREDIATDSAPIQMALLMQFVIAAFSLTSHNCMK
jgi:hypothetical protein